MEGGSDWSLGNLWVLDSRDHLVYIWTFSWMVEDHYNGNSNAFNTSGCLHYLGLDLLWSLDSFLLLCNLYWLDGRPYDFLYAHSYWHGLYNIFVNSWIKKKKRRDGLLCLWGAKQILSLEEQNPWKRLRRWCLKDL